MSKDCNCKYAREAGNAGPVAVKPKAIVLLSGGLDSTTCAKLAVNLYGAENVIALSISYGQKHEAELDAACNVATELDIEEFMIVNMPIDLFEGGGSTLVDKDKVNPEVTYEELRASYGVSPTYVPFRNANFLSVATTIALKKGAEVIFYGAHAEDAKNFAYPDCTAEFNGSMAAAIYVGTYHKVRLVTPLQWLDKAGVAKLATDIGAPVALTMSCYNGQVPACGKCSTCVSRREAFASIGLVDPIKYAEVK